MHALLFEDASDPAGSIFGTWSNATGIQICKCSNDVNQALLDAFTVHLGAHNKCQWLCRHRGPT